MNLTEAVASGDELAILEATRDIVAAQLEATDSGRDIAALSKQMQELTEKICAKRAASGRQGRRTNLAKARELLAK